MHFSKNRLRRARQLHVRADSKFSLVQIFHLISRDSLISRGSFMFQMFHKLRWSCLMKLTPIRSNQETKLMNLIATRLKLKFQPIGHFSASALQPLYASLETVKSKVSVQIAECICRSFLDIFVQICQYILCKLLNVFVQITKCITSECPLLSFSSPRSANIPPD